jgi:hypothetical protein
MRFHEPDVREAYRRGARDLYEGLAQGLKPQQARKIEAWLNELDAWEDGEPPAPHFGS